MIQSGLIGNNKLLICNSLKQIKAGYDVVNHIEHKRNRSGISRLVAGPAAATYCQLVASYTAKGRQTAVGAHQFGELDGMPLFKVPSTIIPNDKILCV